MTVTPEWIAFGTLMTVLVVNIVFVARWSARINSSLSALDRSMEALTTELRLVREIMRTQERRLSHLEGYRDAKGR